MTKVCHITTIHPAQDTRIFQKECCSLAARGFDVSLIVANQESAVINGVKIINVDIPYRNRLQRMWRTKGVLAKALEIDAAIYHFHGVCVLS